MTTHRTRNGTAHTRPASICSAHRTPDPDCPRCRVKLPAEPMLLDPERCACHKPTLIATFRREQLAALELRHLRTNGCAYPAQAIDVETWRKPW